MYVNYRTVGGIEYATAIVSKREGKKIIKERKRYLGRVIDKEKQIFKNKENGMFQYNIENDTCQPVPSNFIEPQIVRKNRRKSRPNYVVSFGDSYFLDQYLKQIEFYTVVDSLQYPNQDSVRGLLAYYILCNHANQHAQDWYELTFAKYLYPKAQLSSQRISDLLKDIGSEGAKRDFFKAYSLYLDKHGDLALPESEESCENRDGILIDSTGLPNSCHLPITAVNNHNGTVSNEIRLIYAIQQKTGLPLFFRYVAGNIIDASTIVRTIAELKANGINTKFAILDAGYYNHVNADTLLNAGISFLSRLDNHFSLYKTIIEQYRPNLEVKENLGNYNGRHLYIKPVDCTIGKENKKDGYAYLCLDLKKRRITEEKLEERSKDQDLTNDEFFNDMTKQGIFILISSRKISKDKLISLYYTRDRIEKIFEIDKSYTKLLPLQIESEDTFRGHLMMTFMAVVIYKLLSDKLKTTPLTLESVFLNLHEQHALIYEDQLITSEPVKKMNEAYKAIGIKCPVSIPLNGEIGHVNSKTIGN